MSRGDFLLSINGTSLAGLAHGDVLKILHQAQPHRDALVVIRKGNEQQLRPSSKQEPLTANGKALSSNKTLSLEPGPGKKLVQQPAHRAGDAGQLLGQESYIQQQHLL